MTRFFISYARDDGQELALALADKLRELRHEVFLDIQGIPGGKEWEKALIERAQWCDTLLLLVTNGSNNSKYVYQEFREAEKNRKTILPIIINKTDLPVYLSKYHALFYQDAKFDEVILGIQLSTGHYIPPIDKRILAVSAIVMLVLGSILGYLGNQFISVKSVAAPEIRETIGFISAPQSGSTVPRRIVVEGFYKTDALLDKQIWVFVEPQNDRYYPHMADGCLLTNQKILDFEPENNKWSVIAIIGSINDVPQSVYRILLMAADMEASEILKDNFRDWCEVDSFPGLTDADIQRLNLEIVDFVTVTR